MYQAALAYYGLQQSSIRSFAKTNGGLMPYTPHDAAERNVACWTQANLVEADFPYKKPQRGDIAAILNVTLDFEYPQEPAKAHSVGLALAGKIVEKGLAAPGVPVEDSGAGCHIVLPLPIMLTELYGGGELINNAVKGVVERYIEPEFKTLCEAEGVLLKLEAYNIDRIISLPGTWRPGGLKSNEVEYLTAGYVRRWLNYGSDNYPIRQECQRLHDLIIEEATALQSAPKPVTIPVNIPARQSQYQKAGQFLDLGAGDYMATWIKEKANSITMGIEGRSGYFQSLVNAVYLRFGPEVVRRYAYLINDLSGDKYSGRVEQEIERSLNKAMSSIARQERSLRDLKIDLTTYLATTPKGVR